MKNDRDFEKWLSDFRITIHGFDYYVDFKKVTDNLNTIKYELDLLNTLIGSADLKNDFRNLIEKHPEIIRCLPFLIAVRNKELYVDVESVLYVYDFDKSEEKMDDYVTFMEETGLFNMLKSNLITDFVNYVLGIEVGLDSNARKNRGGKGMENFVESYIQEAGFQKDINYFKELNAREIEVRWGIDLSTITNSGQVNKRFDFVVKTENHVYAIETNFYSGKGGGSKLNETARSYKLIAQQSENIENFFFLWITDGTAWNTAKNNLRETFEATPHVYNITELEQGILKDILK